MTLTKKIPFYTVEGLKQGMMPLWIQAAKNVCLAELITASCANFPKPVPFYSFFIDYLSFLYYP
jgi:hypothetical protein